MQKSTQSRGSYSSDWWSVELPSGWSISEESACVSFCSDSGAGVLKVSAIRKPDGYVAESDISEFIGEQNQGCSAPRPIHSPRYFGRARCCERECTSLAEWWLAQKSVLVYFTYARATETVNRTEEVRAFLFSTQAKLGWGTRRIV